MSDGWYGKEERAEKAWWNMAQYPGQAGDYGHDAHWHKEDGWEQRWNEHGQMSRDSWPNRQNPWPNHPWRENSARTPGKAGGSFWDKGAVGARARSRSHEHQWGEHHAWQCSQSVYRSEWSHWKGVDKSRHSVWSGSLPLPPPPPPVPGPLPPPSEPAPGDRGDESFWNSRGYWKGEEEEADQKNEEKLLASKKENILKSVEDVMARMSGEQTALDLILDFCKEVGVEGPYFDVLSQSVIRFTGNFQGVVDALARTLRLSAVSVKGSYRKYVSRSGDDVLAHWSLSMSQDVEKMTQSFWSVFNDYKPGHGWRGRAIFVLDGNDLGDDESFEHFISSSVHFFSTEDLSKSLQKQKAECTIGLKADAEARIQVFYILIHQMCRILYPSIDLNQDLSSMALGNHRNEILKHVMTDSGSTRGFLAL